MQRMASLVAAVLMLLCAAPVQADTLAEALERAAAGYRIPELRSAPEAPEARQQRLQVVYGAIASATRRATCSGGWRLVDAPCKPAWPGSQVELAALLWTLGYLESGYADWVHRGQCRLELGECDAEKHQGRLVAASVSPWQLKRTGFTDAVWPELVGTGEWSTFQAAWSAARVLSASRRRCSVWAPRTPWMIATIAGYARGSGCDWPPAARRAAFAVRFEARLRAELR